MKLSVFRKQRNGGGALLLTIVIVAFVALYLVAYLSVTQAEYNTVARSQTWNSALVVAEGGVEEGMALLNRYVGVPDRLTNWTMTAQADGWETNDEAQYKSLCSWVSTNGTIFHLRREIDSSLGYYDVYVNSSTSGTNGPEILSIGYGYWNTNAVNMAVTNAVRKLYVLTIGWSQGVSGVVAYGGMDFKGNNVQIDSWNSADPNHSIWHTNYFYHGTNYGTWSDTLSYYSNTIPSRTANVHVATDGTLVDAGNANIYGYLDTAPGGSYSIGSQGAVGDLYWVHDYPKKGLQTGHFKDDMNAIYTSYGLPTPTNAAQTDWVPLPAPTDVINIGGILYTNISGKYTIGGTDYKYVITNSFLNTNDSAYYAVSSLSGSDNLYINASNVVIYLTNGMSSPTISLNTNADVKIWSTGDITFGTVNNVGAYTHAFTVYDVAGYHLDIVASGNATGVSTLYTPSSTITFNGSGSTEYDIIGMIYCYDIKIDGHFNFHFDESLATQGAKSQYMPFVWQEIQ